MLKLGSILAALALGVQTAVAGPMAAMAAPASAVAADPFGGGDAIDMVDRLFTDVAEKSFKHLFLPAQQASQEAGVWRYRYYPDTDTYLGVPLGLSQDEEAGLYRDGIYVMGGNRKRFDGARISAFGEQPLYVNLRVADLVQPAGALACPTNQWRVQGTCTAMVPDFQIEFDQASIAAVGGTYEGIRFATGRNNGAAVVFPETAFNFPVWLKIPNRPSLQFTDQATFDFWTKLDSSLMGSWWNDPNQGAFCGALIAKTDNETGMRIQACPNLDRTTPSTRVNYFGLFSVPNFYETPSGGPFAPLDEWTRITVTQSPLDGYRLYVNKRLVASNPTHRGAFAQINRSDLFVGGGSPANEKGRGSWIQSLKVYQRAMTSGEVRRLD